MQQLVHSVELGIVPRQIRRVERLVIFSLCAVNAFEVIKVGPIGPRGKKVLDFFGVCFLSGDILQAFFDEQLHARPRYSIEVYQSAVVDYPNYHVVRRRIA